MPEEREPVEVDDIGIDLVGQAENEWAEVERVQNEWPKCTYTLPEKDAATATSSSSTSTPSSTITPLTYDEAVSHFMSLDLTEQKKKIVTEDPRSKGIFSSFLSLFFSSSLSSKLITERDSIFAIALIPYDNTDAMHARILQNVYMILQDVSTECARFGPHWEEIGFQGDDPATDLRGVGMFGMIQLFYLVKNHQEFAKKVHKLSRDERQYFPFSVVSLNFTKVTLQTMRSGILTNKFNKRGSIVPVLNELLIGMYYELFIHWKRGHRTISDFPPLLKELTEKCTKYPNKIFDNFTAFTEGREDLS